MVYERLIGYGYDIDGVIQKAEAIDIMNKLTE